MKNIINTMIMMVIINNCCGLYSGYNCKHPERLLPEHVLRIQMKLLHEKLQLLQQSQREGQSGRLSNFNIVLPKPIISDFEYVPTVQGYKFSYQLPDGSRREENAFISGVRMDQYSSLDSRTIDFTAVGVGGRPKIPIRKLSPGSLKALSG